MFSETLMDNFQSPRNVGEIPDADAEAEAENPVCGDRLHVWLRVDGDSVTEVRWRAEGCAPAIAATSAMSELVRGRTVTSARALDRQDIEEALGGLPARKAHAAALALAGLRQALDEYANNAT